MDKCREEFEKQRYWVGLFRTGVDFDVTLGEFGRYISNGTKVLMQWIWSHLTKMGSMGKLLAAPASESGGAAKAGGFNP